MIATVLVVVGLVLMVFVAYHGYKFGGRYGHPWIGLVAGLLLWIVLLGPLFWTIIGKVYKPAAGIAAAA